MMTSSHSFQYRIAPLESDLTEKTFQKMPLAFDTTKQTLVWNNGTRPVPNHALDNQLNGDCAEVHDWGCSGLFCDAEMRSNVDDVTASRLKVPNRRHFCQHWHDAGGIYLGPSYKQTNTHTHTHTNVQTHTPTQTLKQTCKHTYKHTVHVESDAITGVAGANNPPFRIPTFKWAVYWQFIGSLLAVYWQFISSLLTCFPNAMLTVWCPHGCAPCWPRTMH